MQLSDTGIGGLKEGVAVISGKGVFARLKFESGVHRVQRIPETESGGRIHTSAATVAVMPEAEEVDVVIEDKDLRIETGYMMVVFAVSFVLLAIEFLLRMRRNRSVYATERGGSSGSGF